MYIAALARPKIPLHHAQGCDFESGSLVETMPNKNRPLENHVAQRQATVGSPR